MLIQFLKKRIENRVFFSVINPTGYKSQFSLKKGAEHVTTGSKLYLGEIYWRHPFPEAGIV
jgi:hypothetical protein